MLRVLRTRIFKAELIGLLGQSPCVDRADLFGKMCSGKYLNTWRRGLVRCGKRGGDVFIDSWAQILWRGRR